MKKFIATALCATALMAAAPSSAEIIQITTKEGKIKYFDTSSGERQESVAAASDTSRGTQTAERAPMRASGADSTIGFRRSPPAATAAPSGSPAPSASTGPRVVRCVQLHAGTRCDREIREGDMVYEDGSYSGYRIAGPQMDPSRQK
jgi:hypothetical protein